MSNKLQLNVRTLQRLTDEETKQVSGGAAGADWTIWFCGGDTPSDWCTAFCDDTGGGGGGTPDPAPTVFGVCSPGPANPQQ